MDIILLLSVNVKVQRLYFHVQKLDFDTIVGNCGSGVGSSFLIVLIAVIVSVVQNSVIPRCHGFFVDSSCVEFVFVELALTLFAVEFVVHSVISLDAGICSTGLYVRDGQPQSCYVAIVGGNIRMSLRWVGLQMLFSNSNCVCKFVPW